MALEYRNGRPYYYQKRRVNGRVVSSYMGAGKAAQLMADLDRLGQAALAQQRAQDRATRRAQAPPATPPELKVLIAFCQDVTRAALKAGGYHQHKGEWRMARTKEAPQAPQQDMLARFDNDTLIRTMKAVDKLPADLKAEYHRRTAAGELAPLVFTRVTNIALMALHQRLAGHMEWAQLANIETIRRLRDELTLPSDGALERLLIEQILACQLDYTFITGGYAQMESRTLKDITAWQQAVTASEGRYLRAIETLARVRKLAQRAPLQINIGGQQVNNVYAGDAQPAAAEGQTIESR